MTTVIRPALRTGAPPLQSPKDILRRDQLGRLMVACPKRTVPAAWLELTEAERASLVEQPRPFGPATCIAAADLDSRPRVPASGFVIDG